MHLIDAEILTFLFKINVTVVTTREVISELREHADSVLTYTGNGIEIIDSDANAIEEIEQMTCAPGLSFTDRSVLYHAMRNKYMVLTGEKLMTRECNNLGLEVHGILWVMDEMVAICPPVILLDKLKFLMTLPDFRVPKNLCEEKLASWALKL